MNNIPNLAVSREDLTAAIEAAISAADLTAEASKALMDVAATAEAVGVGDFSGSQGHYACPWGLAKLDTNDPKAGRFASRFDHEADDLLLRSGPKVRAFYNLVVQ